MPQHHVTRPRGADVAPHSVFLEGRFGRLFRNLPAFDPPLDPDGEPLRAVAESMREAVQQVQPESQWAPTREEVDSTIPAGYTYLGQFIDHDMDLDSLYGDGPNNDPFMYDADVDDGRTTMCPSRNITRYPA